MMEVKAAGGGIVIPVFVSADRNGGLIGPGQLSGDNGVDLALTTTQAEIKSAVAQGASLRICNVGAGMARVAVAPSGGSLGSAAGIAIPPNAVLVLVMPVLSDVWGWTGSATTINLITS